MESGVSPLLRPYLSLFLAVPNDQLTPEELKYMIMDVNQTQVDKEEQLSNAAYYFENGMLKKAI